MYLENGDFSLAGVMVIAVVFSQLMFALVYWLDKQRLRSWQRKATLAAAAVQESTAHESTGTDYADT